VPVFKMCIQYVTVTGICLSVSVYTHVCMSVCLIHCRVGTTAAGCRRLWSDTTKTVVVALVLAVAGTASTFCVVLSGEDELLKFVCLAPAAACLASSQVRLDQDNNHC